MASMVRAEAGRRVTASGITSGHGCDQVQEPSRPAAGTAAGVEEGAAVPAGPTERQTSGQGRATEEGRAAARSAPNARTPAAAGCAGLASSRKKGLAAYVFRKVAVLGRESSDSGCSCNPPIMRRHMSDVTKPFRSVWRD